MEKEKFSALIDTLHTYWREKEGDRALVDILESRLTSDQMAHLCGKMAFSPSMYVSRMSAHPDFDDQHFAIIMDIGDMLDRAALFSSNLTRTKDQIMMGLYDSHTGHLRVNNAAYNHPCCTDAMRVEYDLTTKG